MRTFVLLALFATSVCYADDATVSTSQSVEVAVAMPTLGLEDAAFASADFSGHGNVTLLNNGLIIVKVPALAYFDESDTLRFYPSEIVAFQTLASTTYAPSGNLQAILSMDDAEFSIEFDSETTGVLTTISAEGLIMQIPFGPAMLIAGPTCSVSCGTTGNPSTCSQTCPVGKACIAYCSAGVAHCDCIAEPKAAVEATPGFHIRP